MKDFSDTISLRRASDMTGGTDPWTDTLLPYVYGELRYVDGASTAYDYGVSPMRLARYDGSNDIFVVADHPAYDLLSVWSLESDPTSNTLLWIDVSSDFTLYDSDNTYGQYQCYASTTGSYRTAKLAALIAGRMNGVGTLLTNAMDVIQKVLMDHAEATDSDIDLSSFLSVRSWCDDKSINLGGVVDREITVGALLLSLTSQIFVDFWKGPDGKLYFFREDGVVGNTVANISEKNLKDRRMLIRSDKPSIANKLDVDYRKNFATGEYLATATQSDSESVSAYGTQPFSSSSFQMPWVVTDTARTNLVQAKLNVERYHRPVISFKTDFSFHHLEGGDTILLTDSRIKRDGESLVDEPLRVVDVQHDVDHRECNITARFINRYL